MAEDVKKALFDYGKHPGIAFDLFPLREVRTRKNLDPPPGIPHRVDFYLVIFITEGVGRHTIDFQEYDFQPGTVLTIRKGQIHQFHLSEVQGYMLLFTEEFVLSYLEALESQKIVQLFNEMLFSQKTQLTGEALRSTLTVLGEIESELNQLIDEQSSSIVRNLIQVLMSRLYRVRSGDEPAGPQKNKYLPAFLSFQERVEAQCHLEKSVEYYASEMAITSRTLNNVCQAVIQKSAKQLINETVILQIKRRLINSHDTGKDIAYAFGFDEPSNFFKFFKKYTGLTPEAFREQYMAG